MTDSPMHIRRHQLNDGSRDVRKDYGYHVLMSFRNGAELSILNGDSFYTTEGTVEVRVTVPESFSPYLQSLVYRDIGADDCGIVSYVNADALIMLATKVRKL